MVVIGAKDGVKHDHEQEGHESGNGCEEAEETGDQVEDDADGVLTCYALLVMTMRVFLWLLPGRSTI